MSPGAALCINTVYCALVGTMAAPRWLCPALRLLVQAILLALLWINFGHESWQKYLDDKVLVTTEERLEERPRLPAVTICPYSSTNLNPDTASHYVETLCKDQEDIAGCIEAESGDLGSAVVSATRGFDGDSLLDTELWIEDITAVFLKKCFTLNTTVGMENDFVSGSLVVKLNKSLNNFVFVHDLDYFVPGLNPFSMPKRTLASGLDRIKTFREHSSEFSKLFMKVHKL